jgi:hypothetical protein
MKWGIRRVVTKETSPASSLSGQVVVTELGDVIREEGSFESEEEATKRANKLGEEYCASLLVGQ